MILGLQKIKMIASCSYTVSRANSSSNAILIIWKFAFKFVLIHLSRSMKIWKVTWLSKSTGSKDSGTSIWKWKKDTMSLGKKREGKTSRGTKDPGQGWWPLRAAAARRRGGEAARRRGETKRDEEGTTVATTVACWSRAGGGAKLHRSACHPQLYNLRSFAPPLHPLVRSLVGYWFPRVATPMGC